MLNREYAPTQGLWNGVGGKIEGEESPLECVIREVKEETGIEINNENVIDKGIISWVVDNTITGGLHVFQVNLDNEYVYATPKKTIEGILDWKKVSWLLEEKNYGVGEMIPHYLPILLRDNYRYHHKCTINDSILTEYRYEKIETVSK
ncbi:NUDIX hydrolase [Sutcliffiella horikoshii]|uniref:NUDIX hydrolase n=1 Tax=Sutcliffiella horikoshii TaxID=79883 RepID=UPI00384A646A